MRAGDLDRLQLLIFDEQILAFADLVAAGPLVSVDDFTVCSSMSCWRSRLPVLRLIWRKEIRSAEEHAAWTAIGQETSESFRYPFQ